MLDILGVPNYLVYSAVDNDVNPSNFPLTGVRIKVIPKGWKVYPETWSFVAERFAEPGFEWLANESSEPQRIYVLPKEGDDPGRKLTIEMTFPTMDEDLLGSRPNDFWSKHQGTFTHFFPNHREHKVSVSDSGIRAWTVVGAHTRELTNIDRYQLEIGQNVSGRPTLGRWNFQLESLERDPRIKSVPDQIELIDTAFQNNHVILDFSPILPPVKVEDCAIYWDGAKLDKKKTKQLLDDDHEFEQGKYKIRLEEFLKASGVTIAGLAKEKVNQRLRLEIEATDFFGRICNSNKAEILLVKPKEQTSRPKPKKTGKLVVELVDSSGKPADVSWLGSQNSDAVNPKDALFLNGRSISINEPTMVGQSLVRTNISGSTVQLSGVPVGSYTLKVRAWIKPAGQAQKERSQGSATARVQEGDNKVKLKLEYWDGR